MTTMGCPSRGCGRSVDILRSGILGKGANRAEIRVAESGFGVAWLRRRGFRAGRVELRPLEAASVEGRDGGIPLF
ncbi:hypothetical protein Dda_6853 [Drechslerella dactyloides]|uniref:Uncharacterized protein n=1 Tax=Drechslerella dactyloides TaxID=74499 RepID=A0AAD6IVM6_DREDA|nr:hypothetical protein Dda_6853 [Drechslerella dactyloides]